LIRPTPLPLRHAANQAGCPVRLSAQTLLQRCLVNGLNNFDKTDGIFTSPYWWSD